MDVETMNPAPQGTNGYADKATKKAPKTKREKIEAAMDRIDLAVAELGLAVDVAAKFDVPGFDIGANLAAELNPVFAKIGMQVGPVKKARGAKA
jgi:hypothetical protein